MGHGDAPGRGQAWKGGIVAAGATPPPSGVSRALFRLPVYLYRWHLNLVLGTRFLLLNHRGRVTGQPRQAVVEVVARNPTTDCFVICSAFGEQSQWYRNLLAEPDASIVVGRRTLAVHASPLSREAGEDAMLDYARRHPRAAKKLAGYMGFAPDGSQRTYRQVGGALPFLRLCPRAAIGDRR